MHIVGNELERLALNNGDPKNSDLLGRSAFNRYYYAAFLITRETISTMQSNWRKTPHAEIPTLLEDGLKKPAKHAIAKQIKNSLLDRGDEHRLMADIAATGSELAQLLRGAYDARLLADYQPEIKTIRDGNVITLNSYKLSTAREWPARTNMLCSMCQMNA